MLQKSFFFLLSLFLFNACDSSYQYDVYVNNATDQTLKVAFKSQVTVDGPKEESITIPPGNTQKIISTIDISPEENSTGTSASHCKYVADHVTAYLQNNAPSKLKWCDKNISFEKTDIQQGEFTITYTEEDF